jgi:hypothetical protein
MKHILITLKKFLARRGAHCRINSEGNMLHVYIRGANGAWVCQAIHDRRHDRFIFYSIYPFRVPARYRKEVSAFMACFNRDQTAVCFEMEPGIGIIRCRTSLSLDAGHDRAILEEAVISNILATDIHLPIIKKVLHGKMTARQGLAEADALRGYVCRCRLTVPSGPEIE